MKLNPKTALCRDLGIDRQLVRIRSGRGLDWRFRITLDETVVHRAQEVYDWLRHHREEYGLHEGRRENDYGYQDDHLYLDIWWDDCRPTITYPIDEEAVRNRREREERDARHEAERPLRERILAAHLSDDQRRAVGDQLMHLPLDTLMGFLDRVAPLPDPVGEGEPLASTLVGEKVNWRDEGF
jgi:hypothetical protein